MKICAQASHKGEGRGAPSSYAVALPEGGGLFVRHNATPQRFVQRGSLVIAQDIDARPTRFDFTRQFGEFVLILLRPVLNSAQNLFGSLGHDINIANRPLLLPLRQL